jgi:hypothetical protein
MNITQSIVSLLKKRRNESDYKEGDIIEKWLQSKLEEECMEKIEITELSSPKAWIKMENK